MAERVGEIKGSRVVALGALALSLVSVTLAERFSEARKLPSLRPVHAY